jgi:hypothetical protein
MELLAFIALTGLICAYKAWRKQYTHAIALGIVCLGLLSMTFLRGNPIDGVVAFAVWTLVSYAVLMFPVACLLFLASAFCYILELQGNYAYAIQVISNLAGLSGVFFIALGTPRRKYRFESDIGFGGSISMGRNPAHGRSIIAQTVERPEK